MLSSLAAFVSDFQYEAADVFPFTPFQTSRLSSFSRCLCMRWRGQVKLPSFSVRGLGSGSSARYKKTEWPSLLVELERFVITSVRLDLCHSARCPRSSALTDAERSRACWHPGLSAVPECLRHVEALWTCSSGLHVLLLHNFQPHLHDMRFSRICTQNTRQADTTDGNNLPDGAFKAQTSWRKKSLSVLSLLSESHYIKTLLPLPHDQMNQTVICKSTLKNSQNKHELHSNGSSINLHVLQLYSSALVVITVCVLY